MEYPVIQRELLKPKSWLKVVTIKSLSFILFLSLWASSSAQPTISFKGAAKANSSSANSGKFPEMTIKNLNPKVGSAIYWERYEEGVWKSYGGTGYVEMARRAGEYRAWYKHGSLGTYTATNTLTVISRKKKLIPSVNAELIPEASNQTSSFERNNDNTGYHSSIISDPALTQNNQPDALNTEMFGFINEPTIYPNPCVKNLNIAFDVIASYSLMVYNDIGVLIFKLDGLNGKTTIETDDWKKGVYFIQIKEVLSTYSYSSRVIRI